MGWLLKWLSLLDTRLFYHWCSCKEYFVFLILAFLALLVFIGYNNVSWALCLKVFKCNKLPHTSLCLPSPPFPLHSSLPLSLLPLPLFFSFLLFWWFLVIVVLLLCFSVISAVSYSSNVYFFTQYIHGNSDHISDGSRRRGIWRLIGSWRQCTGKGRVPWLQKPEGVCFYFTYEDTACSCLTWGRNLDLNRFRMCQCLGSVKLPSSRTEIIGLLLFISYPVEAYLL